MMKKTGLILLLTSFLSHSAFAQTISFVSLFREFVSSKPATPAKLIGTWDCMQALRSPLGRDLIADAAPITFVLAADRSVQTQDGKDLLTHGGKWEPGSEVFIKQLGPPISKIQIYLALRTQDDQKLTAEIAATIDPSQLSGLPSISLPDLNLVGFLSCARRK